MALRSIRILVAAKCLVVSYNFIYEHHQLDKKAIRQLRKIKDTNMQKHIYQEALVLQDFPRCPGIKHLNNHKYPYRLRIGDYRVFFEFDGTIKLISIEEVKRRNEHTY